MYKRYIYLKQLPLLKVLLPFITGTTLAICYPTTYTWYPILCSFGLLNIAIAIRASYKAKKLKGQSLLVSILVNLSIIILAYGLCHNYKYPSRTQYFAHYLEKDTLSYLSLVIIEPITIKAKSVKVLTTISSKINPHNKITTQGKLILYLELDTLAIKLKVGQGLFIKAKVSKISSQHNPYEFDYREHLAQQNIYHSIYLKSEDWLLQEKYKSLPLKTLITSLSQRLKHILSQFIEVKALPIANAILIGQKEDLDIPTMQRYAKSGAMHILAVSGLHVGIIYLIFHYALFFLDLTKLKVLKPYLMVLLLWTYALITGASPSVLRATTMFSFISIGNALQQHVNIYNTLAASALVLLIINPYVIFALGFQLSYLAVFGIIYLQAKLYKLMVFQNFILDKIWSLTSVSIAAQLATFPLGLLYFHQFPNLFFITNLVVIPAAIIIVYLGMALLATNLIPLLPELIGFLLSKTIHLMNEALNFINKIPYSNTSDIHITGFTCLLIYFFIATFVLGIVHRQKHSFLLALLALLSLALIGSYNLNNIRNTKTLRAYKVRGYTAIEIQNGFNFTHYFDEALWCDTATISYSIKPNWVANHIQNQKKIPIPKDFIALSFANKSILVINSNFELGTCLVHVDYVIITHQEKLWLKELSAKIKARKYIFDTSNNPYQIKYWKKDCEDLNLNCYFVSEQNAYEEKLN